MSDVRGLRQVTWLNVTTVQTCVSDSAGSSFRGHDADQRGHVSLRAHAVCWHSAWHHVVHQVPSHHPRGVAGTPGPWCSHHQGLYQALLLVFVTTPVTSFCIAWFTSHCQATRAYELQELLVFMCHIMKHKGAVGEPHVLCCKTLNGQCDSSVKWLVCFLRLLHM